MNARDIETKTCPICGEKVLQRKQGLCPFCAVPLYSFRTGRGPSKRTLWVTTAGGCKDIVEAVRDYIRTKKALPQWDFQDWRPELGAAKTLLNYCGGEHEVAMHVVEAFFDPEIRQRYRVWQDVDSVRAMVSRKGCINTALAYAEYKVGQHQYHPPAEIQDLPFELAAG